MRSPLSLTVEAHPTAATLHLRGALSGHGALRLVCAVRELPAGVRTLRLDLHALRLFDLAALGAVLTVIDRWARIRHIATHIVPPGTLPLPPARPVAVTDPLHIRADPETDPMHRSTASVTSTVPRSVIARRNALSLQRDSFSLS